MLGRPRFAAVAVPFALAIVAACTVFNGLEAQAPPGTDAGGGVDSPPPPPIDNYVPPTDSPPPPPDVFTPPLTYLSLADAAKVCTLANTCVGPPNGGFTLLAQSIIPSTGVPVDGLNYSACMDWLAGPIPPNRVGFNNQQAIFQCIAAQTTCQGAGSCLSLEDIAPGDPRCPIVDAGGPDAIDGVCEDDGGTVVRCNDGVILHCGNEYYAPGSSCTLGDFDNTYWCAVGKISPVCNQQDTCLGGTFKYCGADNLVEAVTCPTLGYNGCGTDDAGLENCASNGVVSYCNAAGSTDCAGPTLLQVCDGLELSPYDCSSFGATCSNKGAAALCARPGDTCTPYDNTVNLCSNSSISLCIGGQPTSFDCSTIGKTCVTTGGAAHCG